MILCTTKKEKKYCQLQDAIHFKILFSEILKGEKRAFGIVESILNVTKAVI